LRQDIKFADGFNGIAPEFQTDGIFPDKWKNIDDAAANCEITVRFDQQFAFETARGES